MARNTFTNTHPHTDLACENAVVTATTWGCNHGDYKLVILWSPDWWTVGGCVPFCRKSPNKTHHTNTHTRCYTNCLEDDHMQPLHPKQDGRVAHLSRWGWRHVSWGLRGIEQIWIIIFFRALFENKTSVYLGNIRLLLWSKKAHSSRHKYHSLNLLPITVQHCVPSLTMDYYADRPHFCKLWTYKPHMLYFLCDAHLCSFSLPFRITYHHPHMATYLTLSSGKGERSLLAVWSCDGTQKFSTA